MGVQISKNETNVEDAMQAFTAVITIINHPQGHWVTLLFHPKQQILEVFDSMASTHMKKQMEKMEKVRYPP